MNEQEIYIAAIALSDEVARAAFLADACRDDPELLHRIERQLAQREQSGASKTGCDEEAETIAVQSEGTSGLVWTDSDKGDGSSGKKTEGRSNRMIDRYRLVKQIGEGGFGEVWLAEQVEPVKRNVALKIIKLGMDTNSVIARFEAERQALAMMDHPNIARVFDAGATDTGRPYFVMELVDGVSITSYCDKENMSSRDRLKLFVQVCGAIQHAHQKGIIHRDLKPNNVLVTEVEGKPLVKVIDFGIAKATERSQTEQTMFTEVGQFIGTPAYMSPEQAGTTGTDIDTRSDIYSLGVLLYELLTGVTPFDMKTLRAAALDEIKRIIREDEPSKPSTRLSTLGVTLDTVARQRATEPRKLGLLLRGDLDWIIMKAMEKDRSRRYESSNGLAMDIERYLVDEPVTAGPPSARYRARKFIRRNRVVVTTGVFIAIALLLGVIGTSAGMVVAMSERDRADAAARAESAARVDAQLQADRAQAVNEFLTDDLLGSVDPTRTQNREITMREVLDEASLRVGARFKDNPFVAASIERTLGNVYLNLSVFPKADEHLSHAEELFLSMPGKHIRETMGVRTELGRLQFMQGNYEQGIRDTEASLEVMRETLGEDDLITLTTTSVLASLYAWNNQLDEAEPLYLQALDGLEKTVGPRNRETLSVQNNLAIYYSDRRELEKAERLLKSAYETTRDVYGDEDPETLNAMVNLVHVYNEMGRLDDAETIGVKLLQSARRTLGSEHVTTLNAINNLAVTYVRQGRLNLSEPLYLEDYETSSRVLGKEHPDTLISMTNLGRLYMRMDRLEDAYRVLSECDVLSRKILPAGHFGIGITSRSLGDTLLRLGRPDEAIPFIQDGYGILLSFLGPDDPGVRELVEKMTQAYEQLGDAENADQWRAKLGPMPD